LDQQIAECSSQALRKLDLEVLTALRLAAYQFAFLDRVPQRAALHESVELTKGARKRSAAPFVNAVLRKLAQSVKRPELLAADITQLSESSSHPLWLVERWSDQYGFQVAQQVCSYNQHVPETALRLFDAALEAELKKDKIESAPGHLLASARRVQSGDVTKTRAFRDGRIAIQDEAAQLVALLVGEGTNILDCCAAPGGK